MEPSWTKLSARSQPPATLVIGYGNDLRGDDGAGREVVERLRSKSLPHLKLLSCHQLTPELADAIAASERTIFVDAARVPQTTMVRLHPKPATASLGHFSQPQGLLEWTRLLYDRCPEAWLMQVSAERFEMESGFSQSALAGIDTAVNLICEHCSAR